MDKIVRAEVLFQGKPVGELAKMGREGFRFQYSADYWLNPEARPIARSFPLREAAFHSSQLFSFFEGLVAEGFLRGVQSETQKIDERDSFQLLLKNGEDLIGAVAVMELEVSKP
ncbi:HipA N-terminal domain-containing protein [Bdellovibrionota bacterium FG-2]